MQKLDEDYFNAHFYQGLTEKLEIEGKSIFAYFPSFFSANELSSVIKYLKSTDSTNFILNNRKLVESVIQAHIFTQISLKIHLLSKLKTESSCFSSNWLEYAVLAGDYFGGRYINAFLDNGSIAELKFWLKGLSKLNQKLALSKMSDNAKCQLITISLYQNALELLGFCDKEVLFKYDNERLLSRSEDLVDYIQGLME